MSRDASEEPQRTSLREVLTVFLRAGFAFGGGLAILAVLEDELVRRRKVLTQTEFLATYAIGRIVPSGTMTALAVAFGQRLAGGRGTVVALAGLTLPAFASTVALTAAYESVRGGPLLELLPVTLLPAALALVLAAGLRLGRRFAHPSPELVIMGCALAGSLFLGLDPVSVLIGGGVASATLAAARSARTAP